MADDQQAEEVVEEKPLEPTPSSEETTESEPVEPSEEESSQEEEEVKPRTQERIKKLTQELRAEREARLRLEQATPQSPAIPEWYDPSTGSVDPNKLQQREQALISQLETLKQQVGTYTKQTEAQQEKEAYTAYPELKSDEQFHEEVIRKMATEFAIGNNPTMKEAADMVMGFAKKLTTKAEKDGARKALEQLAPKEQASLEATGRSDKRQTGPDLAQLSRQSRYGGDAGTQAVLERLKHVPSV